MKEYIEREAVAPAIDEQVEISPSDWKFIDRAIASIPAADVVERKRGEWVVTECDGGEPGGYPAFIEFHCPFCNEPYTLESGEYNWYYGDAIPLKFCHECGAYMKEAPT